jgi:hypothetical protein
MATDAWRKQRDFKAARLKATGTTTTYTPPALPPTSPNIKINKVDPNAVMKEYIANNKEALNAAGATREVHNTGVENMDEFVNRVSSGNRIFSNKRVSNELEQFAGGTFLFTLSVLTARQMAFPDKTYRAGQPVGTILRSGGGLGASKTLTAYEGNGRLEYFIDNVEIESIIAPTAKQRGTNATNISFKVTEPYSMGLFLQTLQVAAAAEHKNYLETPMLLTIEFVGQDDDGNYKGSVAKRFFPLKLVNMDMNVTGGGTVYDVSAVPYNEASLSDNIQRLNTDIELTGSTLQEILDNGEQSLSKVINDRFISQINVNNAARPDEFMIIFPNDVAGTKNAAGSGSDTASSTQSAMYDLTAGGLPPVPRVSPGSLGVGGGDAAMRSRVEQSTQQYIAARSSLAGKLRENLSSVVNDIGKSKMIENVNAGGNNPLTRAGLTWDAEKQIWESDKMGVSADLRTFSFPRESKIQDIIEELVLISEYGRKFAEPKVDGNGMVTWYKIETEVYPIIDATEQSRTGKTPKIYIYKVVPYKVHMSTISNPTSAPPKIDQLKANAAKQYDYIYTGLNNDILDFDITLNNQFFAGVSADGNALSAGSVTNTNNGTGAQGEAQSSTATNGNASSATGTVQQQSTHGTGGGGGGASESVATRVARTFNDSIINSGVDLLTLNFTILGDPYYLADSGMGNYNSRPGTLNVTQDGQMDYQRSEVDIIVNFRTPIDYNNDTGLMEFPQETLMIDEFSGLYKMLKVRSMWTGAKFTQELECIRRRNQEKKSTGNSALSQNINRGKSEADAAGRASGSNAAVNQQKAEGNTTVNPDGTPSNGTYTVNGSPVSKQEYERQKAGVSLENLKKGIKQGF